MINQPASRQQLKAAVCVVGAGPAGITVALELARNGVPTVLLESGLEQPDPTAAELAEGDLEGTPLRFLGKPLTLAETRLRQLGGSSGHWGGMCRPLDRSDVDGRKRAWPISYDE